MFNNYNNYSNSNNNYNNYNNFNKNKNYNNFYKFKKNNFNRSYYNNYYEPYYNNDNIVNKYIKTYKNKIDYKKNKILKPSIEIKKKEEDKNFINTPILFIQDNDSSSNGIIPPIPDIISSIFGLNKKITTAEEKKPTQPIKKIYDLDINKKYIELDSQIKTLTDLIKLSELYNSNEEKDDYSFNLKKLNNIKEPLIELNELIGMEDVKNKILNQVIYFLQEIEDVNDMLHVAITGSPGIGKTSLGVILAKLYFKFGFLEEKNSINPVNGKKENFLFKIYKRSDLIGQYVGHTAVKTQKAIDECLGGVMFIDEAYSLGHEEKTDTFSKECIDTINQNLSENKDKFILIIAGYENQLEKCFFAQNEGLKRRFAFRYSLENYSSKELAEILLLKIKKNSWKIDLEVEKIVELIEKNKDMFLNYGGDIESWFLNIKINHGIRIFGKHPKLRKIITEKDLLDGFELFKASRNYDKITKKKQEEEFIKQMIYT